MRYKEREEGSETDGDTKSHTSENLRARALSHAQSSAYGSWGKPTFVEQLMLLQHGQHGNTWPKVLHIT